jgi:hypothetical protein
VRPARKIEPHRGVRELARVLQLQLALTRKLLATAQQQTNALVRCDASRVAELEKLSTGILDRMSAADEERQRAALALSRELGMVAVQGWPAPPLSELLQRLPKAQASVLCELRASLLEAERGLRFASERNRPLLTNALDFARMSLDAITRLAVRPAGYGPGYKNGGAQAVYLDRSA